MNHQDRPIMTIQPSATTCAPVANALDVLAELIRAQDSIARDGLAEIWRCFGRDPDGIAFDVLLAGLTASQRPPAKIYQFSRRSAGK